MTKVLIIGGGFAGLTIAIDLAKSSEVAAHLVDCNSNFLNSLALHKTHSVSLCSLKVPYESIARINQFKFTQTKDEISTNAITLDKSSNQYYITELNESFDFIVICTGSKTSHFQKSKSSILIDLEDLKQQELSYYFREGKRQVAVIGGGATGTQYAFEVAAKYIRKKNSSISLLTTQASLLEHFPSSFGSYAHKQANKAGIKLHYLSRAESVEDNGMTIRRADDTLKFLEFDLILNFSGIKGSPKTLNCNHYGQVIKDNIAVEGLYAAGDNSQFAGSGLNSRSAQAAVRKGKTVALHILSQVSSAKAKPYTFQSLGYFISLGVGDGIGWMLSESAVTIGLPAYAIKESIEYQFQLLLSGVDTYFFG